MVFRRIIPTSSQFFMPLIQLENAILGLITTPASNLGIPIPPIPPLPIASVSQVASRFPQPRF